MLINRMITRKKRIDSSPKSAICKNIHLLSKETINDTVNLLRTPERPNRFSKRKLNNIGNDESPILSQEPVGITWKWANEGTPIRSTTTTTTTSRLSKFRTTATKQLNNDDDDMETGVIPFNLSIEPETHSPRGLYKFQEEMRKIRFDTESDTNMSCDNINDLNISSTSTTTTITPPSTKILTKDTGYPINQNRMEIDNHIENNSTNNIIVNKTQIQNINNNIHSNKTVINVKFNNDNNQNSNQNPTNQQTILNDSVANDFLNDSDFDQMLLTCSERVEKAVSDCSSQSSASKINLQNQTPDKKLCSGSSSEWDLFIDDGADDLLSNIDIDIPISDNLNNSKFTRHKSMPQSAQQNSVTNNNNNSSSASSLVQKTQVYGNGRFKPAISRKSLTRHESFPITNSAQNRAQQSYAVRTNQSQNSRSVPTAGPQPPPSTSVSQRCTVEEIAEKRRQAIERLKNRNKNNALNMPPKR